MPCCHFLSGSPVTTLADSRGGLRLVMASAKLGDHGRSIRSHLGTRFKNLTTWRPK